jgi:hypothetical protein
MTMFAKRFLIEKKSADGSDPTPSPSVPWKPLDLRDTASPPGQITLPRSPGVTSHDGSTTTEDSEGEDEHTLCAFGEISLSRAYLIQSISSDEETQEEPPCFKLTKPRPRSRYRMSAEVNVGKFGKVVGNFSLIFLCHIVLTALI